MLHDSLGSALKMPAIALVNRPCGRCEKCIRPTFYFIPWYKLRLTAKHPALRLTIHRACKGVDLKHSVYTAGEIGDAFQQIINRPADSTTMKMQALEWWRKSLFPMLTNVEAYTDLKIHDFFTFFNSFFFLGALSHNVTVKWTDLPFNRPLSHGWIQLEGRGFAIEILSNLGPLNPTGSKRPSPSYSTKCCTLSSFTTVYVTCVSAISDTQGKAGLRGMAPYGRS